MRKSIANLPAPAYAGVIRETTTRAAIAQIKNCQYNGATLIDLHMSCLLDSSVQELEKIIKSTSLPLLALNYNNTYLWEKAGLSEQERVDSFLRAIDAGAAGIDMQAYTFDAFSKTGFHGEDKYSFTKGCPKEVVTDEAIIYQQRQLIDQVHNAGAEVLLSCHPGIPMTAEQVVDLALYLEKREPNVIKIVTRAETEDDLLESFRAMVALKREVKTPVSYHAAGKAGMLPRLVNPVLGSHIAFCVDRFSPSSTLEQVDLQSARQIIDNMIRYL